MNRFFLLFSFLLVLSVPAHAQEAQKLVQVRLVAERGEVKPGDEVWVAVEQSIASGWHTYWKNPGDSGTPPHVTWHLPGDFQVGEIQWPIPHKIRTGPLANYGYEDRVILLQKLKIPATWTPAPLTLSADVEVLVCQEECIPEYGTYQLTLNGPEGAQEDNGPYFDAALGHMPDASPVKATYREENGDIMIDIPVTSNADSYDFIPEDWGVVANAVTSTVTQDENKVSIRQKRGDRSLANLKEIKGLLTFVKDGQVYASAFAAQKEGAVPEASSTVSAAPAAALPPLWQVMVFALLGGLILNLMPCVFPVLSIKALNLMKISEQRPGLARLHGAYYTAGVVMSFVAIALLLVTLRVGGLEIGWGFQLQNPVVVTLLAYLLFIIGLNLAGLFELSGHFGNFGNKLTRGEGLKHSFATGVLATLVATPCTAPFMAAAIGAALLQPPVIALCIFAALGFGLALPYLVLSFVPALQKILPRPGAWMETFKQLLAFPMFASAAWLVWVTSQQAGSVAVLGALMGIVAIAFGVWLLRHMPKTRYWRYKVRLLAIVSFVFALGMLPATKMGGPAQQMEAGLSETYSPEKLQTLLAGNDPVFVEMTAAWCITCKVNHAIAIDIASTRKLFSDRKIQYLVGDWTNQDAKITEYLNSFGRNGVPIYVYYAPPMPATGQRPAPKVLPQILTPGIVAGAVQ